MLCYFGFTNFSSALLQTVANTAVLRSICFILLCQLGLFIGIGVLYTRVFCQLKTNSVGISYSLNIQLSVLLKATSESAHA